MNELTNNTTFRSPTTQSTIYLHPNIPFLSSKEIPRPSTMRRVSAQRTGEIEGSVNLSRIAFVVTMVTLDSVNFMRMIVFRKAIACWITWTPRTPKTREYRIQYAGHFTRGNFLTTLILHASTLTWIYWMKKYSGSKYTRAKYDACQQAVNKIRLHCLSKVVTKFG